jgi:hypothetical protein
MLSLKLESLMMGESEHFFFTELSRLTAGHRINREDKNMKNSTTNTNTHPPLHPTTCMFLRAGHHRFTQTT